jgi:hypothetical protein
MRPGQVVEALPFGQLGLQIDVVLVGEELIEFLLVGSVRPSDLSVELRRCGFDVGVPHTLILDMPVEFGLEFMAVIGPDFTDAEGEFADDVIDEVDGVGLSVAAIDLERPYAGCIVDGGILVAPDFCFSFADESEEFDVDLDLVAG